MWNNKGKTLSKDEAKAQAGIEPILSMDQENVVPQLWEVGCKTKDKIGKLKK